MPSPFDDKVSRETGSGRSRRGAVEMGRKYEGNPQFAGRKQGKERSAERVFK